MNPNMKMLVEEFEKAINESVCESDRIATIVTDMKRAGYDITLVLEATIGVTSSNEGEIPISAPARSSRGEMNLTDQDCKFLRALKIATED